MEDVALPVALLLALVPLGVSAAVLLLLLRDLRRRVPRKPAASAAVPSRTRRRLDRANRRGSAAPPDLVALAVARGRLLQRRQLVRVRQSVARDEAQLR